MHHAEWLIQRILFLQGKPIVSKLNPLKLAETVQDMMGNNTGSGTAAVRAYNAAIRLSHELDDQATGQPLTDIFKMEEGHVHWAGEQRALIQ